MGPTCFCLVFCAVHQLWKEAIKGFGMRSHQDADDTCHYFSFMCEIGEAVGVLNVHHILCGLNYPKEPISLLGNADLT